MSQPLPAINACPLIWRDRMFVQGVRSIPEEAPVALTYDGTAYAVMMATPNDLKDFAIGFSISEGVIGSPADISSLDILQVDGGFEARIWLNHTVSARHQRRRRTLLGPTGCGLCGVESIEEALKPLPRIKSTLTVAPSELCAAMASLPNLQNLHASTRAVHAAALYRLGSGMLLIREDVGRHNALDKLVGAVFRTNQSAEHGIVLLTSRISIELVQKTARLGVCIIAAISAPTGLAVRAAQEAGITLAAIVRGDGFEVFTHPERLVKEAHADVA